MGIQMYIIDGAEKVLLAHTAKKGTNGNPETLVDHSNLVLQYFELLCEHNGLSEAISKSLDKMVVNDEPLCITAHQIIRKWFIQAIYLHDLGKVNPTFQMKKMQNEKIEKLQVPGDSSHSLLSAMLYIHIHLPDLDDVIFSTDRKKDRVIRKFMNHVLYIFAYVISRHHTYLADLEEMDGEETRFEKQLRLLQQQIYKHPDYVYYYRNKDSLLEKEGDKTFDITEKLSKNMNKRFHNRHEPFPFYVLVKLLYSTMVACDFYATNTFDTGEITRFNYLNKKNQIQPLIDAFQSTGIYKGVQAYRENPSSTDIIPINQLRSALFVETETQLLNNLKQHLYYLEAPTGSGKTNMSLNLALQLIHSGLGLNKLIYVFPFNALIEQTKQTIDSIFPSNLQSQYRMAVVNSVTPIVTEKELSAERSLSDGIEDRQAEPEMNYKRELLQRQMLQYPVTLTSHVNFFNYLFGIGRESNLAFTHLCNSVIVLDEIQSYRNGIWKEIIHFLHTFAMLLNMKIIVMSATLPKLDLLIEGKVMEGCSLVPNRELYFQNPLFRDRVHSHFELLQHREINEDRLLEEVLRIMEERQVSGKSTRLLIEFITKSSARSFYQRVRLKELKIPIYELTGDDSNLLRKKVLKKLGKDEHGEFYERNVIVVATQVIEAGVDIDMDVGFKDISLLDSEEQFLGRINRSCSRPDCHAYFFYMDQTTKIYRDDWRTENDLRAETYQSMLTEKNFTEFYRLCMGRINEERKKANEDNWVHFSSNVQKLQFKEVEEQMRLILEKQYSLFIDHRLTFTTEKETIELDGSEVWEQFKYLILDRELEYAERIVKLSQIQEKMAYFTYSYGTRNGKLDTPGIYSEAIGSLYYVPNGDRFMDPDETAGTKKFNRNAYMAEEASILL